MILSVLCTLSDATRLRAMHVLRNDDEHCGCELMKVVGATQSRMSRHIQILKQAGLLVDRRDAQWVRYRRNPDVPSYVRAVLDAVLAAEFEVERVDA